MPKFLLISERATLIETPSFSVLADAVAGFEAQENVEVSYVVEVPENTTWLMLTEMENGSRVVIPATEAMRMDPRLPKGIDEKAH